MHGKACATAFSDARKMSERGVGDLAKPSRLRSEPSGGGQLLRVKATRYKDRVSGAEAVNTGETDRLANYWVGMTSVGRLIQAGPGRGGGSGSWRTKRSGCAA
jgi:hypothetical protein